MVENKKMWSVIVLCVFIVVPFPLAAMDFSHPGFFPNFYVVYEVKEGDTLIGIAREFGVSVQGLRWANNLQNNSFIRAGDEMIIPRRTYREIPEFNKSIDPRRDPELSLDLGLYEIHIYHDLPEVDLPRDQVLVYQVRSGDTLSGLARRFNTSVTFIQSLNELPTTQIREGQRLYLPTHTLTPRQALSRTISQDDIHLLARTIHAEARGEPYIGQVAVGAVIINRVLSSRFPDTFHGVIYQPQQFSCVGDGQINLEPNQTAYDAARDALDGIDPTNGALYYYNPAIATATHWLETREVTVVIGGHVFAE